MRCAKVVIKVFFCLLICTLLCSCGKTIYEIETTLDADSNVTQNQTEVGNEKKEKKKKKYKSPYDFDKLKKENPDIIAWIDIPNTDVSHPVFQHKEDDGYYVDHDRDGSYSVYGEIFTETAYNNADFSDAVTVVYGHKMKDGSKFGRLQELFADEATTELNPEIIIYTPDTEYHYTVFAATTFDNRHILYNYDLSSERIRSIFFEYVSKTRSIDTFFNSDVYNNCNGNFIILSTCKNMNLSMRFLVMAGECKSK